MNKKQAVMILMTIPFLIHELFHFLNWLEFGLHYYQFHSYEALFFPFFEASMLGFVVHASIFIDTQVALILAILWLKRKPKRLRISPVARAIDKRLREKRWNK